MPTLKEDLTAISREIKTIEQNSKMAEARVKGLGEQLKFNPNDTEAITNKYKALTEQFVEAGKKVEALNKQKARLEKEQGELDESAKDYAQQLAYINKKLDDTNVKLQYAKDKQENLEKLSSNEAKNTELKRAVLAQVNEQYAKQEQLARRVQLATLAGIITVKQWTTQSAELSTELYSVSKRFNISAEEVQKWDRALQLATGQTGLYQRSLKELVKTFAEVASGRGIATENVLRDIGLAYSDLAEMSSAEQFQAIIEALKGIENQSLRASYAQKIFKEAGVDIAGIFNDNSTSLDEYLEKAERFGIISNENVQRLAELKFELEATNSQLDVAKAELIVALLPAIQTTTEAIRLASPVIKTFGEGFQKLGSFGGIAVLALTGMLILYPRLVASARQHAIAKNLEKLAIQQVGNEAVKTTTKLQIMNAAMGWIGIALSALSLILGLFGKKADETNKSLQDTVDLSKGLMAETGGDFTTNTEQYATSNKEYYMQADVNIHGEGDTPIGDENAIKVAQYTADALNKSLGELVK